MLYGLVRFLVVARYRGLLLSSIGSGLFLGTLHGFTASAFFFIEDWTPMDGETVQKTFAGSSAVGIILSAIATIPFGLLVDRLGGLICVYAASVLLAAHMGVLLAFEPTPSLVVGFWLLFPVWFCLFMTGCMPYLLARVYPEPRTLSRDVGLWAALGAPVAALVTSSHGQILTAIGTTDQMMLGDRGQYLRLGYTYCFGASAASFLLVPLLLHFAGSCCRPRYEEPKFWQDILL